MDLARALEGLDRLGFEGLRWLLSVLWQSSLLLAAAAGLALLLRRRRAAVRRLWDRLDRPSIPACRPAGRSWQSQPGARLRLAA